MKIYCGIDIVMVERIRQDLIIRGFKERVFTDGEISYCEARKLGSAESYAARFAAKEAFLKAIGTGLAGGISLRDVEIVRTEGKPVFTLHNKALEMITKLGVTSMDLSISHTKENAVANVVLLAEKGDTGEDTFG